MNTQFPPAYQAIIDELVKIRQLLEKQKPKPKNASKSPPRV
jgi:hypothetical protein